MAWIQSLIGDTFSSLKIRNYRLYFAGQAVSATGTFMQNIAQPWLVLQLTNSGTALGIVTALQYLPILLLSPWGGLIADRFPKRNLLMFTQAALGVLALVLGALVATGAVRLWMVYAIALVFGLVTTIDTPARQAFIPELVGKKSLKNAVTLYNSQVNLARVIGPAIAGLIIAGAGLMPCFILNGVSYAAVIAVLLMMDASKLSRPPAPKEGKGQISEGFRYVLSTPVLRNSLIMMAIIGTLTYEFTVSLPLIAQFTFGGDAGSYAALTSAMGIGAVIGGLYTAGKKRISPSMLTGAAVMFGIAVLTASAAPTLALTMAAMVVVGMFSIYFTSMGTIILQLESEPEMMGRVMALWSIAYMGSTTIGGPIVGWVGEAFDPRYALALGGVAALVAAAIGAATLSRYDKQLRGTEESFSEAEEAAEEDRRLG